VSFWYADTAMDASAPKAHTVSDKTKGHEEQDEKKHLFSINLLLQGGLLDSMDGAGLIRIDGDVH